MKTIATLVAGALVAALLATPVHAQQAGAQQEHHPAANPESGTMPTPGMRGGGMPMGMPMMDMCHQMMANTMGAPMMGGAAPQDPKERGEMLEMRGEMMKAMGDIMMKHARRMQGMTSK